MHRNGYETDDRLLDAIDAITGGDLDCEGQCGGHVDLNPYDPDYRDHCIEDCNDPAVVLWREGGRENELRRWLDKNHPGWRADAPLAWGAGELTACE